MKIFMRIIFLCFYIFVTALIIFPISSYGKGQKENYICAKKALAFIRLHIIYKLPGFEEKRLGKVKKIGLDSQKYGKRYWCFQFPDLGRTHYYINKYTGFIIQGMPVQKEKITGPEKKGIENIRELSGKDIKYAIQLLNNIEFYKKENDKSYLLILMIDPELAELGKTFNLILRLDEGNDPPLQEYYFPEFKIIGEVKHIENMESVTFVIKKSDLKKYKYICPIFNGSTIGGASSAYKINEIPTLNE